MNAPANIPADIKPGHLLKLIKIGNSVGVILPKDMLAKLGASGPGDRVDIIEQPDGIFLRKHDAGFAEQMKAAREVMERRRTALSELAK